MKIAVISDIHGNLNALRAVRQDWDACRVDAAVCLGDSVGYGPEPEEVIRLLTEQRIPWIMGNHELGIVDPSVLPWFNTPARKSLMLTRQLISEASFKIIGKLKKWMSFQRAYCVHGCPPCSPTRYLFDMPLSRLRRVMDGLKERICFVGHTHLLEIIHFGCERCERQPLNDGFYSLDKKDRYVVNVGSVGQPRDGDNRAKYVIWDNGEWLLEVRFVPYDVEDTVQKIIHMGFPEINAWRLRSGDSDWILCE